MFKKVFLLAKMQYVLVKLQHFNHGLIIYTVASN